jgi:hypothetical protein
MYVPLNHFNDFHHYQSAQLASTTIETWFGPRREGFQTYAAAFHAAWTQQPDAGRLLNEVVSDRNAPAVARASALIELGGYISPANFGLARSPGLTAIRWYAWRAGNASRPRQPAVAAHSPPVGSRSGIRIRALALRAETDRQPTTADREPR